MRTLKFLMLLAASAWVATTAAAQETLTIGFTVSQTGALTNDATSQMRGMEMWRDDVNAKGGIKAGGKTYTVKFISYDDESQNTRVQQLYSRLITQDKAQFLFSPYSSGLVATAAIISEQYGKAMITTGGAEEKTYRLGNKNLFQLYTGAAKYLAGAVAALKSKDPKAQVAYVYESDPFSKAVAGATRDLGKEAGFSAPLDESYPGSTTDFSPIINKVISSKANALLGGGHYADGATLARQLHDQKAGPKMGVAPGRARQPEIRRAGRRGGRHLGALAVGAAGDVQARLRTRCGRTSPSASPRSSRSSPAITPPAAMRPD